MARIPARAALLCLLVASLGVGATASAAPTTTSPGTAGAAVPPVLRTAQVTVTSAFMDSEFGDSLGQGQQLQLPNVSASGTTPANVQISASSSSPSHTFDISLAAPTGGSLGTGSYENAQQTPDLTHPGLNVVADSRTCTTLTGRFIVDDATYASGWTSFSARFEAHCNSQDPALFGTVSYNSAAPFRSRSITPSSLNAGTANVGGTGTSTQLSVTNNGPSDLAVGTASVGGADAASFELSPTSSCINATLTPTQRCTFDLTFAPTAGTSSSRTALFTFFDDLAPSGGGGTGRDVILTGTAANQPIPWAPLSGYLTSDAASETTTSGQFVFAIGADNALWYQSRGANSWSSWLPLGGYLSSVPAATADGSGGVYVFGRGADDALWYRHFDGANWSQWATLGGYLASPPTAVSASSGLYVFSTGADSALWYRKFDGANWVAWATLGGDVASFPSATTDGTSVYVFVVGADAAGWYQLFNGSSWSPAWTSLGGYLTSDAVGVTSGTTVNVFARGGDDALWVRPLNPPSSAWQTLGNDVTSDPAATTDGTGIDVFVRGADGALWGQRYNGTAWSGWVYFNGYLTSDPSATSSTTSEDLFVRGGDLAEWWQTMGVSSTSSQANRRQPPTTGRPTPFGGSPMYRSSRPMP